MNHSGGHGIANHKNNYNTGVRVGSWVEDTFGHELAQRRYVPDKSMYTSESKAQFARAKLATKPAAVPFHQSEAMLQNINLFRPDDENRFVTSNDCHFATDKAKLKDRKRLMKKLEN